MILVTGATGNIGSALLEELSAGGAGPLRAVTRDASRTVFPEGVEAVEGDLSDPDSLPAVLEGVRAVFLLPGLGPDAEFLGAARRAGVEHVVLVSSITVQTHPHLGPARRNLEVERLLRDSGMGWTVLRPTQFASNTLMWADAVRARETVEAPYADTALPTVHPADIAAVARVALTRPGHRGRTYAVTGPEPVSPRQQAAAIGAALGREVAFAEIGRAQARAPMAAAFGEEAADAVLDVIGGDPNEEIRQVRDTVLRVTGVPARAFREWARENAAAFR
ncbi:NAD(P)H-binding protein [Streptomyces sp. NPDC089799]|uniref:SDR family oxidoreductase n=1 Tax=Streptomyces sp. NPDC089799 TaxID=3155066 RepID=UPI00344048DD